MLFEKWLADLDRVFLKRFGIDHIMGGFSEAEMKLDYDQGEDPVEWVERIGEKYDLDECGAIGSSGFGW
jgi:hypothetical protein